MGVGGYFMRGPRALPVGLRWIELKPAVLESQGKAFYD
jgi:hypothetical protein